MIKTVLRLRNGLVFVFDENGEQVPEYQGQYESVRQAVFDNACRDTAFHCVLPTGALGEVCRQEW